MYPSRCDTSAAPVSRSSWSRPSITRSSGGSRPAAEEGGEPVGDVHDVVAAASGEDVAWPAGDARCAEVAFAAGEVGALPEPGCTAPQQDVLGAVVTGEHHKGVVGQVELVEEVEKRAEIGVQLEEAVGPVPLPAAALELGSRDHRHVHQRVVEVEKERGLFRGAFSDERLGSSQVVEVAVAAHLQGQLVTLGDVRVALADLQHA